MPIDNNSNLALGNICHVCGENVRHGERCLNVNFWRTAKVQVEKARVEHEALAAWSMLGCVCL